MNRKLLSFSQKTLQFYRRSISYHEITVDLLLRLLTLLKDDLLKHTLKILCSVAVIFRGIHETAFIVDTKVYVRSNTGVWRIRVSEFSFTRIYLTLKRDYNEHFVVIVSIMTLRLLHFIVSLYTTG